jgi:hypothetical protein
MQVHLLFLRSWTGMGRASLRCTGGCKCQAQEMDGHWDRQATLTDLFTLEVSGGRRAAAPFPRRSQQPEFLAETSAHAGWWASGVHAAASCLGGRQPGPCKALTLPLHVAQVTPHPKCRLEVEVLKGSSSGEHRFSLSGVVVSSLDAKMERGKIGQWDIEQPS